MKHQLSLLCGLVATGLMAGCSSGVPIGEVPESAPVEQVENGVVPVEIAGRAASRMDRTVTSGDRFDGDWSVKWCDRTNPDRECGGFYLSIVQDGKRLCGTYFGARPGLSQIDEGGDRSVGGTVAGDAATMTIESGRSGVVYRVSAAVLGEEMRWKVVETVVESQGDIDVIAYDATLRKAEDGDLSDQYRSAVSACKAAG